MFGNLVTPLDQTQHARSVRYPQIFTETTVAGVRDPGYTPCIDPAHPFHVRGKSLATDWHWLEGDIRQGFTESYSLGKGASRSLRSEFVDGIAVSAHVAHIHHKQIASAVKGQTLCAVGHGAKGRPTMPA